MLVPRTVLVYRVGSIGDFVIALPSLHLIRRRFPRAQIVLLTNRPNDSRAAPAMAVLEGSGLVDDCIVYPLYARRPRELAEIRAMIRAKRPDMVAYLAGYRGAFVTWRDYLFLRLCGIRHLIGLPFGRDRATCRVLDPATGRVEREAERLGRCIASLGDIQCAEPANWDLGLTASEQEAAARLTQPLFAGTAPVAAFIALSLGTKQAEKDWGADRWRDVVRALGRREFGLALIGGAEDRTQADDIAKDWPGPVVNCCGAATPRVSAAVIRRAKLFLGPDSGPMHLAAAVSTPCVAVFSNHRPPGMWFPFGPHAILYPPAGGDIRSITPLEVIAAAQAKMGLAQPVG